MKKIISSVCFLIIIRFSLIAQLTGDFLANSNFYFRDTSIGANTSQYQHELSSTEAWLFLNYSINDFNFRIRYDLFNNSALLDPNEVYTDHGLGFYQANKKIGNLELTAGHFYDQFASGIIFRAYEDRILGLDYAVNGINLKYNFSETFRVKAFAGRQKNRFETHKQAMKGINMEKDFLINDDFKIFTGAGMVNRTLDQATMNILANEINGYKLEDRFIPKYNVYAATFYNTLVFKNFNWYVEYAFKSKEAVKNKEGDKFILKNGYVFYTTMNYSRSGFGIIVQHKRSDFFSLRTSPFTSFLVGTFNYMPPMSRQHAKTLPARYSISALELGENATQVEITFSPNKKNTLLANGTYVENSDKEMTFRELYLEYYHKFSKKLNTTIGIQSVYYNIYAYQNEREEAVETLTPFSEIIYKFDHKRSLRGEIQYLFTQQDHGDFFFGLLEFTIAPHYSFSVSDMVNTKPLKLSEVKHYYNFFFAYSIEQTRFSIGYAKQVEGIVCTGGVCRVEPAFSGIKFNLSTSF